MLAAPPMQIVVQLLLGCHFFTLCFFHPIRAQWLAAGPLCHIMALHLKIKEIAVNGKPSLPIYGDTISDK